MIKSVFLKKINDLDKNKLLEITFSQHINIIIGPKGGGKSTLFDLLAGLKQNYISKNVKDALKSFSFEFVKAKKFNGEDIMVESLISKTTKEKEENFKPRNDVIFQDDPIKKNINSSNEIEKEKTKYLKKIIENDPEIKVFISDMNQIYSHIKTIISLSKNNEINWTNFFKIKDLTGKVGLMVKLNYNNDDLISMSKIEINNLDKIITNNDEQINKYKNYIEYDFSKVYEDMDYNQTYKKNIKEILEKYISLNKLLNERKERINRIMYISSTFKKAYVKNIDAIKQNDFSEGVKSFIGQSKEYFIKNSKEISIAKKLFTKFVSTDFYLKSNYEPEVQSFFLSYKLNENIKLTDENLYNILETIFYVPNTKTDISKWILKAIENGVKMEPFDESKIIDEISKLMKDQIIVLADGMNYDNMSLGQKSIYGIKYKFEHSKSSDLFLDQPEDNLDNHTIAENILKLIESKKDNQVFIVTHNANIGILTNPEKIIVADLNSIQPYTYGEIISNESEESKCAYYLEGGTNYLEKRFRRIVKGEK